MARQRPALGPDIACALASGARFGFLGRSFMYGVAALGGKGGDHTMTMLKRQLRQVRTARL